MQEAESTPPANDEVKAPVVPEPESVVEAIAEASAEAIAEVSAEASAEVSAEASAALVSAEVSAAVVSAEKSAEVSTEASANADATEDSSKRKREEGEEKTEEADASSEAKKFKNEDGDAAAAPVEEAAAAPNEDAVASPNEDAAPDEDAAPAVAPILGPAMELNLNPDDPGPAPVPASEEGTSIFADNDVLSGRGGGTNVHPGNRNFRDLINLHRRAYLKARKNDKPAISRAIVRSVREAVGRFLKKDEKSGLWFEIGDDAAREKTSQALRQRAPEMRKLLFDTEREEARAAAEEHLRQQRMLMGMGGGMPGNMPPGMQMPGNGMYPNPALMAMANKNSMNMPQGQDPYSQMFSAAILNGGMNRFAANGS
jgi:hypothetical protein